MVEACILKATARLTGAAASGAFAVARSCGFGYTAAMRPHVPARHTAPARPLAPWRVALLCLMMALLPVRGWAWTTMAVQTAVAEVAQAETVAPTPWQAPPAAAMPPCHGHSDAPDADTPPGKADPLSSPSTHSPHHGCSLCDLCHAGVLPPQMWLWSGAAVPHGNAPRWAPATDTGRQGDGGLFRPPRG